MKKVLITGGAGYIGAHTVVELIEAGYEPVIVDDLSRSDRTLLEGIEQITARKVTFFQGDCGDEDDACGEDRSGDRRIVAPAPPSHNREEHEDDAQECNRAPEPIEGQLSRACFPSPAGEDCAGEEQAEQSSD